MNGSEKQEVENDFWNFMRDSIWYCARNVTRSATAAEKRNGGVSLEALSEKRFSEYTVAEESHELEDEIEMIIRDKRFAIKGDGFRELLDHLIERENSH